MLNFKSFNANGTYTFFHNYDRCKSCNQRAIESLQLQSSNDNVSSIEGVDDNIFNSSFKDTDCTEYRHHYHLFLEKNNNNGMTIVAIAMTA